MKNVALSNELFLLLHKNTQVIEDYKKAKKNMKYPELEAFFNGQLKERREFASKLSKALSAISQESNNENEAQLSNSWMDINSAILYDSPSGVIEECLYGENAACCEYDKILDKAMLDEKIRIILERHRQNVQQAIGQLYDLGEYF